MKAFIAIGSNIPPRREHITKALELLKKNPKVSLRQCSDLYETKPVGMDSTLWFLNGVCEIYTDLKPMKLMRLLLHIEEKLGRNRALGMDREIDLDLLYYDNQILDIEGLTLPHPRLAQRSFVLQPWREIAPDLVVAPWNKSISELYEELIEKG